jgi:hypothetical protein
VSPTTKPSLLALRLEELGDVTGPELSAMVRLPLDRCEALIAGAKPDALERIHLRVVFDPEHTFAAELAVEKVRVEERRPFLSPEGDAAVHAPHYAGGFEGDAVRLLKPRPRLLPMHESDQPDLLHDGERYPFATGNSSAQRDGS